MSSTHRRLAPLALVLLLSACAPGIEAEDAAVWANSGSALGVYTNLHVPVGYVVGPQTFVDPGCPVRTDDGTTVTIMGDCTDSEGTRYEGSVTITRVDGPRDLDLIFDGYGSGEGDIAHIDGTAQVRQTATDLYSYEVDIVSKGGVDVDTTYSGTISGDYGLPTTFNGSGKVTRKGVLSPTGTAQVSTVDQLVDDSTCSGQSVSGNTTIEVDGYTIVITYDGETDCDENNAARWSLDGKDQGLVNGITCSVASDGGGQVGAMLLVIALLGLRRRRTSLPPARRPPS